MKPRDDTLSRAQRTRTGRLWLALVPAIVFLILLIVFIAENGQHVEVKFFGATGHISLALALLISAVAGAVLVLLIGSVRIAQLRIAAWRHSRGVHGSSSPAVTPTHEPETAESQSYPPDAGQ